MVVTPVAVWKRLILIAVVAVAALLGSASTAIAQEDDGPSLIDTAGDGLACAATAALGGTATIALETFGAITGTTAPSCADAAQAVVEAPGNFIKKAANGAFETAGLTTGEAGASILKFALGWWITIPGQDESSFMATLGQITEYTYYIQIAFLTVSVMYLGIRLMMARSGSIRDVSTEGLQQLARATVLSGSIGFMVVLGTRVSDNVSRWFIDGTVGSDPDALVDAMIQIGVYATPGGATLLYVIGFIGILGGLVMAFLLLMRMGLLVVICAALPIAGAAGGTKVGSQAYEKMIAWTLAFLLFKPVGSFVIGVAAMLFMQSAPSREDNGGAMTALIGALLLCSAALVLPSLMRLIVPAVGAMGGGGSGMAAMAGAVAVGAKVGGMLATGGASGASGVAATTGPTGDQGPVSGADTPAPANFGTAGGDTGGGDTAGGGNVQGGNEGTPSSQSGTPGTGVQGGAEGTPAGQGSTPSAGGADEGSRDHDSSNDSMVGAAPAANNGGFEG